MTALWPTAVLDGQNPTGSYRCSSDLRHADVGCRLRAACRLGMPDKLQHNNLPICLADSFISYEIIVPMFNNNATGQDECNPREIFLDSLSAWPDCRSIFESFLDNNTGWEFFIDKNGAYLLISKQWGFRPRKEKFPIYLRSRRREVGDEEMLLKAGVIINSKSSNRISGKILSATVLQNLLAHPRPHGDF
jgi:hypothetical protein